MCRMCLLVHLLKKDREIKRGLHYMNFNYNIVGEKAGLLIMALSLGLLSDQYRQYRRVEEVRWIKQ